MTTLTDNFNRANGDIGSSSEGWSWTVSSGDFDIVSNECSVASAGLMQAASDLATDDHYSQATIRDTTITNWGVTARHADADNFYLAQAQGTSLTIFKNVSGFTQIAQTTSLTIGQGDVIKLECNGSDIKIYENAVERVSVSDASLSGQVRCGIRSGSSGRLYDDFEAADIVVGGTTKRYSLTTLGVG
jgi:hypothetical protein